MTLVFQHNLIFSILRHTPGPNIFTFYLLFTLALLRNSGDSFQVNFSQLTLNLWNICFSKFWPSETTTMTTSQSLSPKFFLSHHIIITNVINVIFPQFWGNPYKNLSIHLKRIITIIILIILIILVIVLIIIVIILIIVTITILIPNSL